MLWFLLFVAALTGCEQTAPTSDDAVERSPYSSCRVTTRCTPGPLGGGWNRVIQERYNAAGHLATVESDWYDDGLIDEVGEGFHDEHGRLVRMEWLAQGWSDEWMEGEGDAWVVMNADMYTWDASGQLVERGRDYSQDGIADWTITFINGFLGPLEGQVNHDGVGDYNDVDIYRYDRYGQLDRIDHDLGRDEVMDSSTWYEYGDDEVSVLHRDGVHGDPYLVTRTVFDEVGRPIYREFDHDMDHVADEEWTYHWTCPPL